MHIGTLIGVLLGHWIMGHHSSVVTHCLLWTPFSKRYLVTNEISRVQFCSPNLEWPVMIVYVDMEYRYMARMQANLLSYVGSRSCCYYTRYASKM